MALSLEGIRNRLKQQGLIESEPEPSFYTYGAVPTSQVTDNFAAEQARQAQMAEQARIAAVARIEKTAKRKRRMRTIMRLLN